jgi:hypothetical protein
MTANGEKYVQVDEKIGGASRDRTDDLIVANDALSQLSYSPALSAGFPDSGFRFYQRAPDFAYAGSADRPVECLRT